MDGRLTTLAGTTVDATDDLVRQHLGASEFFWLDLDGVDDEAAHLLQDVLGYHALAVEDAEHFGQRPKVEEYFGQNFSPLVNHALNNDWTFWVFGVGIEVAAVLGLLILFRRRDWMGGPSA